jgi:hypothetical protein
MGQITNSYSNRYFFLKNKLQFFNFLNDKYYFCAANNYNLRLYFFSFFDAKIINFKKLFVILRSVKKDIKT